MPHEEKHIRNGNRSVRVPSANTLLPSADTLHQS